VIKTTIITSLYKAEKYLQGFLKDITRQTVFDECELYLLDAASPENEYDIAKPYLDKHSNIRYERLDKDPGIYACWNHMIKNSNSDYITNANVDDKLFANCIERHNEALDNFEEYDLVYCHNTVTDNPETTSENLTSISLFPTGPFSKKNMLACNLPHNHPVWRRSLHDECGYFEEDMYVSANDYDFWLRCVEMGKEFFFIPEVLGIYYRNPEGVSTKQENMDRNLKEVYDIREKYSKRISNTHV